MLLSFEIKTGEDIQSCIIWWTDYINESVAKAQMQSYMSNLHSLFELFMLRLKSNSHTISAEKGLFIAGSSLFIIKKKNSRLAWLKGLFICLVSYM